MKVRRIDHVQLAMPPGKEQSAIAFYEGLLGIPCVPKPPELAARGGCGFEDGSLRVHVGVDPDFVPARKAHPALEVSELEELANRLRASGVHVSDLEDADTCVRCYVADPFGNRIELMESR